MNIKTLVSKHKKLLIFLALCCIFMNLCLYWPIEVQYSSDTTDDDFNNFVLYNDKCRMPEVDPWNAQALVTYRQIEANYENEPLIVKMERDNGVVYLLIDERRAENKSVDHCTSCIVLRGATSVPDDDYQIVDCENFTDKVAMHSSIMYVECFSCLNNLVYKDVLANYVHNNREQIKPAIETKSTKPFNVMIIGYDSISRQHLQRTMPETIKFLHSTDWVEFIGYNTIAGNTLQNLLGVLTGKNVYGEPRNVFIDDENFLWKEYQNLGYVTVFIEGDMELNTFNNRYSGFKKSPTNFYFRPYTQIMESLSTKRLFSRPFRTSGRFQRILDLGNELPKAFENQPFFGFFWINTATNDDLNTPQLIDNKTVAFFKDLLTAVSNDTFVIFMSGHGFRLGPLRRTLTGWYEGRMPFLYISVPEPFKKLQEYQNLQLNSKKLVSGFDLYMTLQDILMRSNVGYVAQPAVGCPQCASLFQNVPNERSCREAGILEQLCTCSTYDVYDKKQYVMQAANEIVTKVQKIIDGNGVTREKCWRLKLAKIVYVKVSKAQNTTSNTVLLLVVETNPMIVLEALVHVNHTDRPPTYSVIGDVIRIDSYKQTSGCVPNINSNIFCYCSPYGYILSYAGL